MTKKKKPADAPQSDVRLEKMPLSKCLEMRHDRNPKDHDLVALAASFKRFGFVAFPTIDEASETMVAGHGRCEALAEMRGRGEQPPSGVVEVDGDWMLPVVRGVSFKSERERDAYVIADNQNVMAGGWKFDMLSELLTELRDDGGFEGLGFEKIELDALLGQYADEQPDNGQDPETMGNDPNPTNEKPRTEITARIECPHCGKMIER